LSRTNSVGPATDFDRRFGRADEFREPPLMWREEGPQPSPGVRRHCIVVPPLIAGLAVGRFPRVEPQKREHVGEHTTGIGEQPAGIDEPHLRRREVPLPAFDLHRVQAAAAVGVEPVGLAHIRRIGQHPLFLAGEPPFLRRQCLLEPERLAAEPTIRCPAAVEALATLIQERAALSVARLSK